VKLKGKKIKLKKATVVDSRNEEPFCLINIRRHTVMQVKASILRYGHCFGSSRTRRITGGKITTFKLGHPVLTVA